MYGDISGARMARIRRKEPIVKEMIKRCAKSAAASRLAELLVVVAIVAVLVAIAVPLFSSSLTERRGRGEEGERALGEG